MNPRLIIGLILFVLILIFTVQNATVVSIRFLFWELSISRALMIFFVAIAGFLIGWFAASMRKRG